MASHILSHQEITSKTAQSPAEHLISVFEQLDSERQCRLSSLAEDFLSAQIVVANYRNKEF